MSASAENVSGTMELRKTTLKPSACCGVSTSERPTLSSPIMAVNHITAKDVAAMMGLLKVARIATGSSPDSFVDLAGYAACAGEIATKEDSNV